MIQVLQLLLSLSILVFIHELGHFTFAKLFKTRVEKFYLFFNPWFSLFKFKKGETEYGLGWLPLGGYVKIAGMIDESMDKEQMKQPAQPWEFRAKNPWQRLMIMVAGVLFNFILAFVIYISVLYHWGTTYLPMQEVNKNGIMVDSLGSLVGLQNGDKIISVNNKNVKDYSDVFKELVISEPHEIIVERNNQTVNLKLTNEDIAKILNHKAPFFNPRLQFVIEDFTKDSPAEKAGIKKGDKIIGLDSFKIEYFDQFKEQIANYKGKETKVTVLRGKDTLIFTLNVPSSGIIGIAPNTIISNYYSLDTVKYSFWQAIPAGINTTFEEVGSYLKQLKLIFTPKTQAYKSVGSFITIGKLFPKKWDWEYFWHITAILSIMLGVVNLLPIPALDGGHALFTVYEIIFKRKPSDKFLEKAQIVGMVLLLLLIVYALGNDIFRNFIK